MNDTSLNKRLLSLDVLRGITVAGMILVNNSGGKLSYDSLQHAEWNGLTFCDLVFPFFLFIMGISTYIALNKFNFQSSSSLVRKVLKRTLIILCIGWAIHWFGYICKGDFFPFGHLRLTGVLPRIALCYCVASFIALYVNHKYIGWIIGILLVGYTVLLCIGNGYNPDETNILGIIDRNLLGSGHLYYKSIIDPEGLTSTLPAIAHTLIGFYCGRLILKKDTLEQRTLQLFVVGFILMAFGFCLTEAIPLNKRIWSPSFVLVTCGLAAMLQSVLIYFIDMKGKTRWCRFFEVFGVNPLFLYVLSEVTAIVIGATGVKPGIYGIVYLLIPDPYLASAVYALVFTLVMGAFGYILYKRKIYIKI
ncbi:acyltransferase family protein [Dysgonomonas macrotermitis]|uniref:Predicted acyltransferase n=1 Tax=Dysgonomonas macrotermitis TaxID=1346286 RepID=A0A1M4X5X0_9BACT|nr:heparan-alpha-glucosaminide N-acetyltransferase domain-containing protein [Dysgonomonas macrotermitis]SHE88914.1 Predicted acyltransferase [Dysgonomonas macrotermitis]